MWLYFCFIQQFRNTLSPSSFDMACFLAKEISIFLKTQTFKLCLVWKWKPLSAFWNLLYAFNSLLNCAAAAKIVKADVFTRCLSFHFEMKWSVQQWQEMWIKHFPAVTGPTKDYTALGATCHQVALLCKQMLLLITTMLLNATVSSNQRQMQMHVIRAWIIFLFVGLPSILNESNSFSKIC